ncbi:MAG TPA: hypothetical protein VKR83_10685 [Ktedonobacteraceae bacterium]|nr:hypothetical protein [Ktedonobacteraceae bacterium]
MYASSAVEYNVEEHHARQDKHVLEPRCSPRIVYIRAAVTNLDSPLIPFAVLKENPLPNFYAARETRRPHAQEVYAAKYVGEIWHQPFAELTSAQRYFLVAWSAVPRHSSRIAPVAELAFGIATPGPYYKRWITTCAVGYQGEPVAWCIEVDMLGVQEEVIEIVLTEEDMLRLLLTF